MPFARSNTTSRARSKSRSPIPPNSSYFQKSPPQFYPPSHYAAASGFTYGAPYNEEYEHDPAVRLEEPAEAFIPMSYDDSYSESDTHSHAECASVRSRGKQESIDSTKSRRRHSQIGNLPLVEAQLLPSLKDTIDRMTRAPSNASSDSRHSRSSRVGRSISPAPPTASHLDHVRLPPRPQTSMDISQPALPASSPDVRTPDDAQRLGTKPLKSVLRAPNPKIFSQAPSSASATPSIGSTTLKSVKSILRRRPSTSSSISTTETPARQYAKAMKQQLGPSRTHERKRSSTDPVAELGSRATASERRFHVLRKPNELSSHIPRPRGRSFHQTTRSDDSDLDIRLEEERRDRMKLVVANADVSPSSSEDSSAFRRRAFAGHPEVHSTDHRFLGRSDESHKRESSIYSTNSEFTDDTHIRRKQELLGLVNNLGLDSPSMFRSWKTRSEDSSEYLGEDGLAVSGSLGQEEGGGAGRRKSNGCESGSDYGDDRDSPRKLTPTLLVSPDDGTGYVHNQRSYLDSGRAPSPRRSPGRGTALSRARTLSDETRTPSPEPPRKLRLSEKLEVMQGTSTRSQGKRQTLLPSPNVRSLRTHQRISLTPEPPPSHGNYQDLSPVPPSPKSEEQSHPQQRDSHNYEAVSIALQSRIAAARDREVLGIPPSQSDEDQRGHRLSHAESDVSSIGDEIHVRAREEDQELSFGAESLFRKLSGRAEKGQTRFSDNTDMKCASSRSTPSSPSLASSCIGKRAKNLRHDTSRIARSTPSSPSVSNPASATVDKARRDDRRSPSSTPRTRKTSKVPTLGVNGDGQQHDLFEKHKRSLPPQSPAERTPPSKNTLAPPDPDQERRQTISAFREDERRYVERLVIAVDLFILPLRVQDTKLWVTGVPGDVSKLLDWLEDIYNLHMEMAAQLELADRRAIAPLLRPFVSRLEVYLPYLVKLPEVIRRVQNMDEEFAEYVRIQEGSDRCRGLSFDRLLSEPVQRIMDLPNALRRLLEKTPKAHEEYLSTLALSRATDLVFQAMIEVKSREDDYDYLKVVCDLVEGLPDAACIAKRDRKILAQGMLYRLTIKDKPAVPESRRRASIFQRPAPAPSALGSRSAKLIRAMNEWNINHDKGSFDSAISTGSTSSASSIEFPITPPVGASPRITRLPTSAAKPRTPFSPYPNVDNLHSELVQVWVLTDIVLIALPVTSRGEERWRVPDDFTIMKILEVTEIRDEEGTEPPLFILDVLPLNHLQVENNEVDHLRGCSLYLTPLPEQQHLDHPPPWTSALRKSKQHTLQSLSIPMLGNLLDDFGPGFLDETHAKVDSILTSGLPLPKSPSLQFRQNFNCEPRLANSNSTTQWEREERGWWTLRFHQVLRELCQFQLEMTSSVAS